MRYLLVFMGSGAGGVLRYLLSRAPFPATPAGFPIGTLAANLTGCLLIGFLAGLFEVKPVGANLRLFLFTGLLGGFTTFSAFGLETLSLLRSGGWKPAVLYVLLTNLGGLGLAFAGWIIGNRFR